LFWAVVALVVAVGAGILGVLLLDAVARLVVDY
jgi:hypothetical protein